MTITKSQTLPHFAFSLMLRTEDGRAFGKGADVIVNGVIRPRGDDYDPSSVMTVASTRTIGTSQRTAMRCLIRGESQ